MENVVFEQFKFAESPWDRVCSLKFFWAQLLIWVIHIFFINSRAFSYSRLLRPWQGRETDQSQGSQ